jgi:hypothetical protein
MRLGKATLSRNFMKFEFPCKGGMKTGSTLVKMMTLERSFCRLTQFGGIFLRCDSQAFAGLPENLDVPCS